MNNMNAINNSNQMNMNDTVNIHMACIFGNNGRNSRSDNLKSNIGNVNDGNNGASNLFGGIGNDFSNLNGLGSFGNLNMTTKLCILNTFGDGNGSALGFK